MGDAELCLYLVTANINVACNQVLLSSVVSLWSLKPVPASDAYIILQIVNIVQLSIFQSAILRLIISSSTPG